MKKELSNKSKKDIKVGTDKNQSKLNFASKVPSKKKENKVNQIPQLSQEKEDNMVIHETHEQESNKKNKSVENRSKTTRGTRNSKSRIEEEKKENDVLKEINKKSMKDKSKKNLKIDSRNSHDPNSLIKSKRNKIVDEKQRPKSVSNSKKRNSYDEIDKDQANDKNKVEVVDNKENNIANSDNNQTLEMNINVMTRSKSKSTNKVIPINTILSSVLDDCKTEKNNKKKSKRFEVKNSGVLNNKNSMNIDSETNITDNIEDVKNINENCDNMDNAVKVNKNDEKINNKRTNKKTVKNYDSDTFKGEDKIEIDQKKIIKQTKRNTKKIDQNISTKEEIKHEGDNQGNGKDEVINNGEELKHDKFDRVTLSQGQGTLIINMKKKPGRRKKNENLEENNINSEAPNENLNIQELINDEIDNTNENDEALKINLKQIKRKNGNFENIPEIFPCIDDLISLGVDREKLMKYQDAFKISKDEPLMNIYNVFYYIEHHSGGVHKLKNDPNYFESSGKKRLFYHDLYYKRYQFESEYDVLDFMFEVYYQNMELKNGNIIIRSNKKEYFERSEKLGEIAIYFRLLIYGNVDSKILPTYETFMKKDFHINTIRTKLRILKEKEDYKEIKRIENVEKVKAEDKDFVENNPNNINIQDIKRSRSGREIKGKSQSKSKFAEKEDTFELNNINDNKTRNKNVNEKSNNKKLSHSISINRSRLKIKKYKLLNAKDKSKDYQEMCKNDASLKKKKSFGKSKIKINPKKKKKFINILLLSNIIDTLDYEEFLNLLLHFKDTLLFSSANKILGKNKFCLNLKMLNPPLISSILDFLKERNTEKHNKCKEERSNFKNNSFSKENFDELNNKINPYEEFSKSNIIKNRNTNNSNEGKKSINKYVEMQNKKHLSNTNKSNINIDLTYNTNESEVGKSINSKLEIDEDYNISFKKKDLNLKYDRDSDYKRKQKNDGQSIFPENFDLNNNDGLRKQKNIINLSENSKIKENSNIKGDNPEKRIRKDFASFNIGEINGYGKLDSETNNNKNDYNRYNGHKSNNAHKNNSHLDNYEKIGINENNKEPIYLTIIDQNNIENLRQFSLVNNSNNSKTSSNVKGSNNDNTFNSIYNIDNSYKLLGKKLKKDKKRNNELDPHYISPSKIEETPYESLLGLVDDLKQNNFSELKDKDRKDGGSDIKNTLEIPNEKNSNINNNNNYLELNDDNDNEHIVEKASVNRYKINLKNKNKEKIIDSLNINQSHLDDSENHKDDDVGILKDVENTSNSLIGSEKTNNIIFKMKKDYNSRMNKNKNTTENSNSNNSNSKSSKKKNNNSEMLVNNENEE